MDAEQIIKGKSKALVERHEELITMFGDDTAGGNDFLLNELALIELELRNRKLNMKWSADTVKAEPKPKFLEKPKV